MKALPIIACFIFLLFSFSGYGLYFTKTSIISIDINPSIELNINRFDRVISINKYYRYTIYELYECTK